MWRQDRAIFGALDELRLRDDTQRRLQEGVRRALDDPEQVRRIAAIGEHFTTLASEAADSAQVDSLVEEARWWKSGGCQMIAQVETYRLRLRPFTIGDAPAIFAYARDPEIARLGMWSPSTSLEETRDEIGAIIEGYQRGDQWTWAIEQKSHQTVVGRCDLLRYRQEHRSAEIGYALARHVWGQGYATEAVHALIRFGFDELALHRLEAVVLAFNAASIRVLEKIGMQREGVKREAYFLDGRFVDLFSYGLLTPGR